jgi:hypothetical protein
MIIKHKHGRLESLPRQDLPHNSNSSLKTFNLSHAYLFASIGRFLSVCLVGEPWERSGADPLPRLFGWGAAGAEPLPREYTLQMRVGSVP